MNGQSNKQGYSNVYYSTPRSMARWFTPVEQR